MRYPSKETVNRVKEKYPPGTRVELISMSDRYAPPVGTKGTVTRVGDLADLEVDWDNGSRLNVVYGEDYVKII